MGMTTFQMCFKRIISEYYQSFCAYKFENLDEMTLFLERNDAATLSQGKTI